MMDQAKRDMLRKVQSADFTAHDIALFLDTHPCCEHALKAYKEKVAEAKAAREEYEKAYGPLTPMASASTVPWQWIENPWTWDKGANY
ncbi:MAG: spore coat protein CotJB [Clostridia bacterium]|nr:spore coat protein CotJB [Clostridia bacterium]